MHGGRSGGGGELTPRRPAAGWRALHRAAVGLGLGAAAAPAAAHPFQASLFGHELRLELHPAQLTVDATFEEPTPEVLRDYQRFVAGSGAPAADLSARYLERRLEELGGALEIYADGQRIPTVAEPVDGRNGTGGADFIKYRVRLRAELPAGVRGLGVVDRAHPDERVVWSWTVRVDPALRVDESTLLRPGEAGWTDLSGAWIAGGEHREQRLSVGRRGDARRALAALGATLGAPVPPGPLWTLGEAAAGADGAAVGRGAAALVALVAAGGAAAFAALRRRERA